MRALSDADLLTAGGAFDSEELADRLEHGRKKRRYAYLAWLFLGSHYLYLRRPAIQALFWLSLGGLLIWWAADLLRIPGMVERCNRRAVGKLLRSWQAQVESRLQAPRPAAPWPLHTHARVHEVEHVEEVEAPAPAPRPQPEHAFTPSLLSHPRPRRNFRPAAYTLAALLLAILIVPILAPRPVYPRGAYEPSHRTLREVNVRALPTTGSPIVARIEKNVLIRGRIEEIADARPSAWLKITRGPHKGRYVALQNLGRR